MQKNSAKKTGIEIQSQHWGGNRKLSMGCYIFCDVAVNIV